MAARRKWSARPTCEALEGRALLAHYSAYDPTFGQDGVVIGALDAGSGTDLSRGSAVAIQQSNGKIIEVGTYGVAQPNQPNLEQLAVRRFTSAGVLDTTFGTNGQADIPLPSTATGIQVAPQDVGVQADGSILVAATAGLPGANSSPVISTEGFVAKLTAAGLLDPTFGTGGEYVFAGTTTSAASVAVDGNGNVVVLGGNNDTTELPNGSSQSPTANQLVVTRLTAAGVPDASFNGTGSLDINLPASQLNASTPESSLGSPAYDYVATALAIDPKTGLIYVAGNDRFPLNGNLGAFYADLSRVKLDGTLDTTFGTGGTTAVGTYLGSAGRLPSIEGMAFDPNGNLVVVGNSEKSYGIQAFINRLLPGGTLDPTFAGNSTGGANVPQTGAQSYNSVVIGGDGSITVGASGPYSGVGAVVRFTPAGAFDTGFGTGGRYQINTSVPAAPGYATTNTTVGGVALTAVGNIVVAGGVTQQTDFSNRNQFNLVAQLLPVQVVKLTGDYDGDGKSDIAAYLPASAVYAYRPSSGGTSDILQGFGTAGAGASIPAPGDYDGDGKTDIAVFIHGTDTGHLWYRSSAYGSDASVLTANPGSIPAPGDYDGDGKTDAAVYDPTTGSFLIQDSYSGQTQLIPFGAAGPDGSIPAPGDYDGDGKTDLAVYLPASGVFAYRPSSGGPDVLTSFGMAGDRMSIPTPGDYDGDGRTDLAVYMPSIGVYAYRPSSGVAGGPDVLESFGVVGDGASIPAPGDYDGDGKYDLAVYIPQYALYAYRPSSAVAGSSDALTTFGNVGNGVTIPTSSIPYAQPPTVSAASLAFGPGSAGPLAMSDEELSILTGSLLAGSKKKGS